MGNLVVLGLSMLQATLFRLGLPDMHLDFLQPVQQEYLCAEAPFRQSTCKHALQQRNAKAATMWGPNCSTMWALNVCCSGERTGGGQSSLRGHDVLCFCSILSEPWL